MDEWRWPLQRSARGLAAAVLSVVAEKTAQSTWPKKMGISSGLLLDGGESSPCTGERLDCAASPLDPGCVC